MKQLQTKKRAKKALPVLLIMLFLSGGAGIIGCSESGMQPAVAPPAPVTPKQQVITRVTATPAEEKPQAVFSYNPLGKRDPFSPIIVREEQKALAGERPPLERFNIYDFKMTGVVWGGYGYTAMLEGPDGKGYFVRTGAVLGQNRGVVKKITQNLMIIEEKFKTISGEISHKEIVIELRKKQEGTQ